MQPSTKDQFKAKYPQLFPEKGYLDFSPPSGWIKIMHKVCEKLVEIKTKYPDCGIQLAQVKEKFGGLRVYLEAISGEEAFNEANSVIDSAELDAYRTCESCGHEGEDVTTEGPGWIVTLCPNCRKPKTETLP